MMLRGRWRTRYSVLAVLFVCWMLSFMDRMVMSVAIPYISTEFALTPFQSGLVMSAFFAGYSLCQIPGGLLADLFGIRRVAVVSMLWWSAFTALTGAAANLWQLVGIRFVFGLGEGLFPGCVFKAVAMWFPKRERATANAIRMAAGPLGAALSPLVVVGIMATWGWRHVFYLLFIPGILMAILFWKFVHDRPSTSPRVSAEERAEIEEEDAFAPAAKVGFRELIRQPGIVQYFIALFAFDVAYWGFTSWLPTFLVKARGFSMVQMGVAASLPFFAGLLGSLLGGWLSDKLFSQNRKVPIIASQILAALLLYLSYATTSSVALVAFQTAAGFCLNFFFTAFWAMPMTTIRKELMGLASGFINMAGQIAALISPMIVGAIVGASGGDFSHAFTLFVGCLLASCFVMLWVSAPRKHLTGDV